jgi:hypothetical protein
MRRLLAAYAILLAAPALAAAQSWTEHRYPDAGFVVQFPAEPTVSNGRYKTTTGQTAAATTYSATLDNVVYAVTVADFSKIGLDGDAAVDDAIKAVAATGEITVDVTERINRQYGHELGINGKDGSRTAASIFYFDHKLYLLLGKAMPPNATSGSGKLSRFQQSLQFPNR